MLELQCIWTKHSLLFDLINVNRLLDHVYNMGILILNWFISNLLPIQLPCIIVPLTWSAGILCQAYLLEVDMTQIPANHEALIIVCHVGIHVDFSPARIYLDPWTFTFYCEVNLDGLSLFNQWHVLECNDHGPLVLCVMWPKFDTH